MKSVNTKYFTTITLVFSFLFLVSCSNKSPFSLEDSQDNAGQLNQYTTGITDKYTSAPKEVLEDFLNFPFDNEQITNFDSFNTFSKVVKPLVEKLITTPWILFADISSTDRFKNMIQEVNRGFIVGFTSFSDSKDFKSVLFKYVDFILKNCDQGHCSNFENLFATDKNNISIVLNKYASLKYSGVLKTKFNEKSMNAETCAADLDCKTTLLEFYNTLHYASDFASSGLPNGYRENYISYIENYLSLLKLLKLNKQYSRINIYITNLITKLDLTIDTPENQQLIDTIFNNKDIFLCSKSPQEKTFNKFNVDCLSYLIAAAPLVFDSCDGTNNRSECDLSPTFKIALDERKSSGLDESLLNLRDNHFKLRSLDYLKFFEIKEQTNILKEFGVNSTSFTNNTNNILWFYIESTYHGDLNPISISDLESKIQQEHGALTSRDADLFEEILLDYLKIELLRLNSSTNTMFAEFFEKGDSTTAKIIQDTFNKSDTYQTDWDKFYSKTALLKDLYARLFSAYPDKVSVLKSKLENIGLTTNYINVYPNMTMLLMFMQLKEFKQVLKRGRGFKFEFNYVDVVKTFLDSGISPWFEYGEDSSKKRAEQSSESSRKLKKFQILNALSFAHKTHIFDTFGKSIFEASEKKFSGEESITEENNFYNITEPETRFYKDFITAYISDDIANFEEHLLNLKQKNDADKNNLKKVEIFCSQYNEPLEDGSVDETNLSGKLQFTKLDHEKIKNLVSTETNEINIENVGSLELESLNKSITNFSFGAGDFQANILGPVARNFKNETRGHIAFSIEFYTSVLKPKLMYVDNLVEVYEYYLEDSLKTGSISDDIYNEKLIGLEGLKSYVKSLKWPVEEALSMAFDFEAKFGNCFNAFLKLEKNRVSKIMSLEKEYIAQFSNIIAALNFYTHGLNIDVKEEINNENLIELENKVKLIIDRTTNIEGVYADDAEYIISASKLFLNKLNNQVNNNKSLLDLANEMIKITKYELATGMEFQKFSSIPIKGNNNNYLKITDPNGDISNNFYEFIANLNENYCENGNYCGLSEINLDDTGSNPIYSAKINQLDLVFRTALNLKSHISDSIDIEMFLNYDGITVRTLRDDPLNTFFISRDSFFNETFLSFHGSISEAPINKWWNSLSEKISSVKTVRGAFLTKLYSLGEFQAKQLSCYERLEGIKQPYRNSLSEEYKSECEADQIYKIPSEYIVEEIYSYYSIIGLTDEEKDTLIAMGQPSIYTLEQEESLFRDGDQEDKEKLIFDEALDLVKDRNSEINVLKDFLKQTRGLGKLLFDYNYDYLCHIKHKQILQSFNRHDDFENLRSTIDEYASEFTFEDRPPIYFKIDYSRNAGQDAQNPELISLNFKRDGKQRYYNDNTYGKGYNDNKHDFFNEDTSKFYAEVTRNEAGDVSTISTCINKKLTDSSGNVFSNCDNITETLKGIEFCE